MQEKKSRRVFDGKNFISNFERLRRYDKSKILFAEKIFREEKFFVRRNS